MNDKMEKIVKSIMFDRVNQKANFLLLSLAFNHRIIVTAYVIALFPCDKKACDNEHIPLVFLW